MKLDFGGSVSLGVYGCDSREIIRNREETEVKLLEGNANFFYAAVHGVKKLDRGTAFDPTIKRSLLKICPESLPVHKSRSKLCKRRPYRTQPNRWHDT